VGRQAVDVLLLLQAQTAELCAPEIYCFTCTRSTTRLYLCGSLHNGDSLIYTFAFTARSGTFRWGIAFRTHKAMINALLNNGKPTEQLNASLRIMNHLSGWVSKRQPELGVPSGNSCTQRSCSHERLAPT